MITLKQKQEIVAGIIEKFKRANCYYIVDYLGLNASETLRLRRLFKKSKLEFKVVKNTLIQIALKETGELIVPEDKLTGQSAILFGFDDAVLPARLLKEEFEKHGKPVLKAAVLEGQYYDGSRLKELAALPGKKEIIASILGSLDAPITGIIGSINAVMRDVASLVEEVAKKQAA